MHARATIFLLCAALLSVLVPRPGAQELQTLILEGQEFFEIGTVEQIVGFQINDDGDWIVHVDTDASPTYAGDVFLRNGIVTLQGGDALVAPPGAEVGALGDFTLNGRGDIGTMITLLNWDDASNEGVFFNANLVAQESALTLAPEFSAGTTWVSFDEVVLNNVDQIIIKGVVDDVDLPGFTDQAIVIVDIDDQGNPLAEQAILWETGPLPGSSLPIERFATVTRSFGGNGVGGFITYLDTTGPTATDGYIFKYVDGELIRVAREGTASPLSGRNWDVLINRSVALNNFGDHAFIGDMSGDGSTDLLLERNGEKLVQEGDILPDIAPYRITSFQTTSIHISNSADVFWFGQFNNSDTSRNQGIFRNREMMVQRGVTRAEGRFIRNLRTSGESFAISPNGRYLVFEATLDDGREGAFMLDLGLVEPMSECFGNAGSLRLLDGLAMTGDTLEFELDNGQGPGVTPILLVSTLPVAGWPSCGVDVPFGELLVDVLGANGNPALIDFGSPWNGVPVRIDLDIPDDMGLVGVNAYVQGLFWDIGDMIPEPNLRLTGGIHIEIVAD